MIKMEFVLGYAAKYVNIMKRKSNTCVTLLRHRSQAQQIITRLMLLIMLIPSLMMVKCQNAMKTGELKRFS